MSLSFFAVVVCFLYFFFVILQGEGQVDWLRVVTGGRQTKVKSVGKSGDGSTKKRRKTDTESSSSSSSLSSSSSSSSSSSTFLVPSENPGN